MVQAVAYKENRIERFTPQVNHPGCPTRAAHACPTEPLSLASAAFKHEGGRPPRNRKLRTRIGSAISTRLSLLASPLTNRSAPHAM